MYQLRTLDLRSCYSVSVCRIDLGSFFKPGPGDVRRIVNRPCVRAVCFGTMSTESGVRNRYVFKSFGSGSVLTTTEISVPVSDRVFKNHKLRFRFVPVLIRLAIAKHGKINTPKTPGQGKHTYF